MSQHQHGAFDKTGGFNVFFLDFHEKIPGEMIQFDEHIFQMGGSTTN